MDQGSTRKRSAVHNFAPTVTKFCVMWEGQALPHDTNFGNSRCEIVGRRVIFIWSLIHGSSWSGLIKVGPGRCLVVAWRVSMPSGVNVSTTPVNFRNQRHWIYRGRSLPICVWRAYSTHVTRYQKFRVHNASLTHECTEKYARFWISNHQNAWTIFIQYYIFL